MSRTPAPATNHASRMSRWRSVLSCWSRRELAPVALIVLVQLVVLGHDLQVLAPKLIELCCLGFDLGGQIFYLTLGRRLVGQEAIEHVALTPVRERHEMVVAFRSHGFHVVAGLEHGDDPVPDARSRAKHDLAIAADVESFRVGERAGQEQHQANEPYRPDRATGSPQPVVFLVHEHTYEQPKRSLALLFLFAAPASDRLPGASGRQPICDNTVRPKRLPLSPS